MTTMYYQKDANPELLKSKKIAILGYGSQGHAHALNLHDSGFDVRVGLRMESSSVTKAEEAGLKVLPIADACAELLLPADTVAVFEYAAQLEEDVVLVTCTIAVAFDAKFPKLQLSS